MSRAFVKEDVDPPERNTRKRSGSGLPPGAVNYLSARGAAHFRAELAKLAADSPRRAQLEEILVSAEIVEPPIINSKQVSFGARVTTKDKSGKIESYTVVGVDELDLEPDAVSWISPLGKALLAAQLGERVPLEDGRVLKIIAID